MPNFPYCDSYWCYDEDGYWDYDGYYKFSQQNNLGKYFEEENTRNTPFERIYKNDYGYLVDKGRYFCDINNDCSFMLDDEDNLNEYFKKYLPFYYEKKQENEMEEYLSD